MLLFFKKEALSSAILLLALAARGASGQTLLSASPAQVLLAPGAFGLTYFPDSPLTSAEIGGSMLYFAADGGRADSGTQGTIVLRGPLDALTPLVTAQAMPAPSLSPPPDDGASYESAFDRDYAGGGPALWDTASGLLLHAYHAEYDVVPGDPRAFYSAIGLAVSRDQGQSFSRLGLIIRPALPPEAGQRVPSSGGTFVPVGQYLYLYYDDISPDGTCGGAPNGGLPCLAVARAGRADVLDAAAHGTAAPWAKYDDGAFSQAGVGGAFSPLFVTDPAHWVRWPMVARDAASGWFFLVYAAGQRGLELRFSQNGLQWSAPLSLPDPGGEPVNYPSIMKITPLSPANAGFALDLTYTAFARNGAAIDFTRRSLVEMTVEVAPP